MTGIGALNEESIRGVMLLLLANKLATSSSSPLKSISRARSVIDEKVDDAGDGQEGRGEGGHDIVADGVLDGLGAGLWYNN